MLNPHCLQLKVPKENSCGPTAMESFLIGIGEIFRKSQIKLSLEILIRDGFLHFIVVCPEEYTDLVKGQLFSQYPSIEIEDTKDYSTDFVNNSSIAILKLAKPDAYPIRTYKDIETDFLSSLSGLSTSVGKNEILAIQLILRPINKDLLEFRLNELLRSSWRNFIRRGSSLKEILQQKESEKLERGLFKATIRIAALSKTKSDLLTSSALSLFKILDNSNLNSLKLWRNLKSRNQIIEFQKRYFADKSFILNTQEIATIYHLPFGGTGITQTSFTKTKTAEPPVNLPTKPTVVPFARTDSRKIKTAFGIKPEDRRKHLYIIGKTGVGKSKLIELLALADIRQNRGCVIMDPHGDLSEEIIRYIPRSRLYDVVYFNPADVNFPMSFNPMEGVGGFEFKQNVVAGFIAIFKKLFSFTWNQRLEHVLRYTTLALLDVSGSTVLGITKMLSETPYRQQVIAQIQDPLVKKFWTTEFSSWNEQFAGEAITPIINKMGQFVANPIVRNIVGQSKSTIKLDEIINNEKILIANFSIGKLGEENSALLGAMFVTKLWQAAVARAALPEHERKDTYLYIDEFQNFATDAFANILSEARKYRLNLTIAHQYMDQLPEEVRSTIFGNVGSIASFRIGGEDASILEKEFKPIFSAEDFMNLDMRHFFIKMTIDGQTTMPFSGYTLDFPKPDEDLASDVVKISRQRCARPKSEVEKEIAAQEFISQEKALGAEAESFSEPLV